MRVALCGNPPPTPNLQAFLLQNSVEANFLIRDFTIDAVGGGVIAPADKFF